MPPAIFTLSAKYQSVAARGKFYGVTGMQSVHVAGPGGGRQQTTDIEADILSAIRRRVWFASAFRKQSY